MKFTQILSLLTFLLLIACQPTKQTTSSSSSSSNSSTTSSASTSVKGIDSARKVGYMTSREKDMVKEINLIRSNPKGYIPIVEQYMVDLEAKKKNLISGQQYVDEEIKTAKELIGVLKNTATLSILQPRETVYDAAKDHGNWMKRTGKFDHKGANDTWPWDRILKKDSELSDGGENLVGGAPEVRRSVLLLLVDSGIPNRGHRKALLDPKWVYVACHEVGTVKDMPNSWIQNFAK